MSSAAQFVLALVAAVSSLFLGVSAYFRSRKVDKVSMLSGAASDTRAGTAQIIDALNTLVDQLQEDNVSFRADVALMAVRLETLTTERDVLKRELTRLRRRYGENGDPATPPRGTPAT